MQLSAVYTTAFALVRQKGRASRMNVIKIYGEGTQRINLNQVYFELRDFLPFAIHTQSYK